MLYSFASILTTVSKTLNLVSGSMSCRSSSLSSCDSLSSSVSLPEDHAAPSSHSEMLLEIGGGLACKSPCVVTSSAGFAARTLPKYEICLLAVNSSGIVVVVTFPSASGFVTRLYWVDVTVASTTCASFHFLHSRTLSANCA